jgi:CheY-like chemotaxis protein
MNKREYSILVADDETAVVRSTIDDIKRIGHQLKLNLQLYPATSGSEVLKLIEEHQIDIIFLDYQFEGGMNGDEIIDNITDPFGDILIVLMSAWEQKELEKVIFKRHRKLGERFKFLRKPF